MAQNNSSEKHSPKGRASQIEQVNEKFDFRDAISFVTSHETHPQLRETEYPENLADKVRVAGRLVQQDVLELLNKYLLKAR